MKRLTLILLLCAALFAVSAQNAAVRLSKTGETSHITMPDQDRASAWLTWASSIDDGVINNSYMDNTSQRSKGGHNCRPKASWDEPPRR